MSKALTDGKPGVSRHASSSRGKSIVVVGPFPAPVHGFSQATMGIANLFDAAGYSVTRIDVKPVRERKGTWASLRIRLRQMAEVVVQIGRGADLYMALSGGRRQAVDILFLLLGKIGGAKLYVHHHSFAYLSRKSSLADFCFRLCGSTATHLVLCSTMDSALSRRYGAVQRTQLLSNSALMGEESCFRQRTRVRALGFLGALTVDKGILEFLQVAAQLVSEYPDLQFRIAGPCTDDEICKRIAAACETNSNLRYLGPVYGEDKKNFFESLDVLLFPSTYRNEAEPFVIWEAQAAGIPVIAWGRGCMEEMLRIEGHHTAVVPQNHSFVDMTVKTVRNWLADPAEFARRSTDVNRWFQTASIEARRRFDQVFCSPAGNLEAGADNRFRSTRLVQIETRAVEP